MERYKCGLYTYVNLLEGLDDLYHKQNIHNDVKVGNQQASQANSFWYTTWEFFTGGEHEGWEAINRDENEVFMEDVVGTSTSS